MEAYLHVPILPAHYCFLRFHYDQGHYQYRALPFGLASEPRCFTKVLAVLVAHLWTIPVRIQCYLNDNLIQGPSLSRAPEDVSTTIRMLQNHGFSVNFAKSHLVPTTGIQHLGAVIDTERCEVFLSQELTDSMVALVSKDSREAHSPSGTGIEAAGGEDGLCVSIVSWLWLHARPLQWLLLPF